MTDSARLRFTRGVLCGIVIICGLTLRRFGLAAGWPTLLVKYGGSLLWGTMVFFLAGIIINSRQRRSAVLIAALCAGAVELFRLYHAPWLDAFRLTTAGALLLGRVFSIWNLVAYGAGIVFGIALDLLFDVSRSKR